MSRIHDALRRAADEQSAADASAEVPGLAEGDGMAALASEPFPVEIGAPRRRRPSPTDPPREKPEFTQESAHGERTDQHGPKGRAHSVFQRIDARLAEKVVADENISPHSREQYRRLAGILLDAQSNADVRAVMVASAVPGEGKTLTATNLALTLSESYRRRVLLIDADLRKPTIHEVFRLTAASGLVEGLEPQAGIKLVVRQVSANLSVLPAGRPTSDPMAALTSERMRQLIEEAKTSFDWVIVDTPPLMLLPDAHLLSSLVDGAVLVVKARSTAHELVKRTTDIIGRPRILGVVLNQVEDNGNAHYGAHYGGYYLTGKPESAQ